MATVWGRETPRSSRTSVLLQQDVCVALQIHIQESGFLLGCRCATNSPLESAAHSISSNLVHPPFTLIS